MIGIFFKRRTKRNQLLDFKTYYDVTVIQAVLVRVYTQLMEQDSEWKSKNTQIRSSSCGSAG